jgi:hypothetical protein
MSRPLRAEYERPRFIGPFFVLALIVAGYLLWRQYSGEPVEAPPQVRQLFAHGPLAERHVVPTQIGSKAPPPDFILRNLQELRLPANTKQALEELSRKSAQQLQPLKDQADRATADFRKYMDRQKAAGHTAAPSDLQKQMAQVQEAMRKAEQATQRFWQDARNLIPPDEKAKLEQKWQDATAPRPPAPAGKAK